LAVEHDVPDACGADAPAQPRLRRWLQNAPDSRWHPARVPAWSASRLTAVARAPCRKIVMTTSYRHWSRLDLPRIGIAPRA